MPANIFNCSDLAGVGRVLLASVGTGQLAKHPAAHRMSPQSRILRPQVSAVARVRNPARRE